MSLRHASYQRCMPFNDLHCFTESLPENAVPPDSSRVPFLGDRLVRKAMSETYNYIVNILPTPHNRQPISRRVMGCMF